MKRLSVVFLISLFFGLNSDPTCIYNSETQSCEELTGNDKIFYECEKDQEACTTKAITCAEIESKSASPSICPQAAATQDKNSKCIYDSGSKACKEALKCSFVTSPTVEKCKAAPTEDTKKICSYNESEKGCEEINKPADETNGGSDMRKILALIFFICLL